MVYKFHEILAAEATGCTPQEMFAKGKLDEAVLARQLSMYFLRKTTKLSLAKIASRFGKDHTTCLAAVKTINDRAETDAVFKEMLDLYMDECNSKKDRIFEEEKGIDIIKNYGISVFLQQQNSVLIDYMHMCNMFVAGDCTDEEVLKAIEEVESAISKVKFNFTV